MGTKLEEDDVFIKPKIPFCESTIGHGLKSGTNIVVCGRILYTPQMLKSSDKQSKMFELKLMSNPVNGPAGSTNTKSKGAIAMQMEVHQVGQTPKVTLNSFVDNKWNKEQVDTDNVPFVVDRNFELIINVGVNGYQLAINGLHCYRYKHHTPVDKVDHLYIGGNVDVDKIQFNKNKTK